MLSESFHYLKSIKLGDFPLKNEIGLSGKKWYHLKMEKLSQKRECDSKQGFLGTAGCGLRLNSQACEVHYCPSQTAPECSSTAVRNLAPWAKVSRTALLHELSFTFPWNTQD